MWRHGILPKKSEDGRRQTYWFRWPRTTRQPNYERTIISQRSNLSGSCGFKHAPYLSDIDLGNSDASESVAEPRAEGPDFTVCTTVALLTEGAKSCEFCHIIWLGLQQYRVWWEYTWNRLSYLDVLADHMDEYTEEEYYSRAKDNLYGLEPVVDRPVDERRIFLILDYEPKNGYLKVQLLIEPYTNSTWELKRLLIALDYFTLEGEKSLATYMTHRVYYWCCGHVLLKGCQNYCLVSNAE